MGTHTAVKAKEITGKRSLTSVLVPVLLVLAGLCVLLYPVVATQWNNIRQIKVAEEYAKIEQEIPAEVINQSLVDAVAYNDNLGQAATTDPWTDVIDEQQPGYQEYKKQLSTWNAMARLVVPAGEINLPIYHGTSHETLQRGVGHLYGTDLPVGGESRHAVMTGHTGLQNATLFDNLSKVKVGDAIYIQAAGQKMKYRVRNIDTVLPTEVESLKREEGKDLVTLVTCTPYGINSHRLLVHAERTTMDPEDEKFFEDSGFHWQWWMWVIVGASILIILLLVLWIRSMRRSSNKIQQCEASTAVKECR
ncbi:class C sortase [Corynebacterium sp. H128]|uniref:class C sortase n=1 Tax=unclassified Corynebacterium TaxID=2624378 RepID=UPI003098203C